MNTKKAFTVIEFLVVIAIILIFAALITAFATRTKASAIKRAVGGYTVETIDDCQYVVMTSGTYYKYNVVSLTHKGNCTNIFHLENKVAEK